MNVLFKNILIDECKCVNIQTRLVKYYLFMVLILISKFFNGYSNKAFKFVINKWLFYNN